MTFKSMRLMVTGLILVGMPCKALAISPLYDTYLNSGWEARQSKNYSKAESSYMCAARLNPRSSEPKIGLLYTYIDAELFHKAEPLAESLLVSDPDNLWVRKGAAWVFFNVKRYDDAAVNYDYVLKKAGPDPDMTLGLGLSQYYAGHKREAMATCRECKDHFDENDPRVRLCLGKDEAVWTLKPNVFISYTDYTDSLIKPSSTTLTTGLELFHESGAGVYAQGSGMVYKQQGTDDTYKHETASLALFYSTSFSRLWMNKTWLDGNNDGEATGDCVTLYGSQRIASVHLGAGLSKSNYDGFHIDQYQPEIGFYLGPHYLLKLSSMIQQSSGEISQSLTEMKTRYSTALDMTATYDSVSVGLAGYYGSRWFTSEDKGLDVWNADEEFEWGGALSLEFHSQKNRSHYVSVRVDKADKQFGLDHDSYAIGISTGISLNF